MVEPVRSLLGEAGAYALEVIGYLLISIPVIQFLSGSIAGSGPGDTPRILLAIGTIISLCATLAAID